MATQCAKFKLLHDTLADDILDFAKVTNVHSDFTGLLSEILPYV